MTNDLEPKTVVLALGLTAVAITLGAIVGTTVKNVLKRDAELWID